MKVNDLMTVGDFLKWVSENDVPNDTPIIIYDSNGYLQNCQKAHYRKGKAGFGKKKVSFVMLVTGFNGAAHFTENEFLFRGNEYV